ncbi:hypothetical protein C8A00DRAFT_40013 [Chaetomidium leptoderma]|uniref:Ubiquitin-like protease family profile domain-containing protein n=1 Tax=Chaetomidium leptoderma TaxID=669021 RepID=A0AAN6VTM6_9PEZI|nr:hypothetical protein C8A00DRAFT_40013 [Chaetomidium leptoderma]
MPSSNGFAIKGIAPVTHLNTLESNPGCSTRPHQTSTARPPARPLTQKRRKIYTEARLRGPDEDIAEDATSRTERYGSQSSHAHSGSPGVSEFQAVQDATRRTDRSNRRSRRPQDNRPHIVNNHVNRGGKTSEPEPIESFDELNPARKPAAGDYRTARLVSTTPRARPSAVVGDSADQYIIGRSTGPSQHPQGLNKGRKRPSHEIADDQDELVEGANGRSVSRAGAKLPTEDSPMHDPPSLSRRGDMKATKWAANSDTNVTVAGASVQAALCNPNFRYVLGDGQDPCFLRPTNVSELRAFKSDGNPAEPYNWLKIAGKAKDLLYHPESSLIKINQARDQASPIPIGALLLLKLCSNAEASWVAVWARNKLGIQVVEANDSRKLLDTWDQTYAQINNARSKALARPLSGGPPARVSWVIDESPTASHAPPRVVSTSSQTPLRHCMRVSGQQQTPSLPRAEPSSELVPSGSRSLRSRQTLPQVQQQQPETPHAPVVRRWSEEFPDWAKDWKMPLILERTTVDKEDIPRLDEGQCLNDNLIGYGLRYLFNELISKNANLQNRVYLHNSFFYEKLKAGRGAINYDGVKSWTAKVDLLSYDYIVVPVNEHYHWWVAIICNPGKLDPDSRKLPGKTEGLSNGLEEKADGASSDVEMADATDKRPTQSPRAPMTNEPELVKSDIVDLVTDDKDVSIDLTSGSTAKHSKKSKPGARAYNPEDPRIITLDSLGSSHPQAIAHLKKYLLAEFEHKRNKVITDPPQQLGMRATNIPEQNNLCDCGVYLLGYIQEFVKDPDQFIQTLLSRQRPDWDFDPSNLRELWRDTIQCAQRTYQRTQLGAKGKKREASAAKSTPKGSTESSRHPSRETSTKATGTPDAREVDRPTAVPAPHDSRTNGIEQPRSPAPVSAHPPQQQPPQQDQPDEDVVLLPPEEKGAILPSIEAPDVEELPGPRPGEDGDEPKFIAKLSTSSANGSDDDEDTVAEVDPRSFYASTTPIAAKSSTEQQKTVAIPSSPASRERRRAVKARPKHTGSHFVVDGSPGLEPVVERAEVVRNSDPIDLT